MRQPFSWLANVFLGVCLLGLFGCCRTITFKTVDGITGLPIAGASVVVVSSKADILLGSWMKRVNASSTDQSGIISVGPLSSQENNDVLFSKEGYFQAVAIWGRSLTDEVYVATGGVAPSAAGAGRSVSESLKKGIVEVRMFKSTLPKAPPPMGMKPSQDRREWNP